MKHVACLFAVALSLTAFAQGSSHPLGAAIDINSNLALVASLRPTNRQLLAILTAARAARQLVVAYENSQDQALEARGPALKQQLAAFKAGTPVPESVNKTIEEYYAQQADARLRMMQGVDTQVRQVRRALAPEQVRMVDWSRPAEITADNDDLAVLEELRVLLADLDETARMLERIRYLVASDYSITRTGRMAEFLRQYYRPNTREFDDAMQWMFRLTDEARTVKEDDWPAQAPLFAARVLQRVGALEPTQRAGADTDYNWWDIYYLLTDAHTSEWLQKIVGAAGNNPTQDQQ